MSATITDSVVVLRCVALKPLVVVPTELNGVCIRISCELRLVRFVAVRRDVIEMQACLIGDKASLRVTVNGNLTVLTCVQVHHDDL